MFTPHSSSATDPSGPAPAAFFASIAPRVKLEVAVIVLNPAAVIAIAALLP
jgi:hypothetical protein